MNKDEIYVYRIQHIPTGLYYHTVTGHYSGEKSNLSERGKVYLNRQPPIPKGRQYISDAIIKRHHIQNNLVSQSSYREKQKMLICSSNDWRIIKYRIEEVVE